MRIEAPLKDGAEVGITRPPLTELDEEESEGIMMNTEIYPCPFCGETDDPTVIVQCDVYHSYEDPTDSPYYVRCEYCGALGPSAQSKEGAVRFWNLRKQYRIRKEPI